MTDLEPQPVDNRCLTGAEPVVELLTLAEESDLRVWVVGDQLHVRGPMVAADLGRALLARKAEVMSLLAAAVGGGPAPNQVAEARTTGSSPCPSCGWPGYADRCWSCHHRPCTGCGRPTGSAFIRQCGACA